MVDGFEELLREWTAQDLAADLGVNYQTAASMRRRGSVAPLHWDRLIVAAQSRGIRLNHEMLARFHVERKRCGEPA